MYQTDDSIIAQERISAIQVMVFHYYFLFLLRHRIVTFNGRFIKSFSIARISITLSGASTAAAYRMTVGDELLNRLVPSVVDAFGPHLDWLKWEVSK